MRTFHVGGTAQIKEESQIISQSKGKLKIINKNLIEDSKKNIIVMGRNTQLSIEDENKRQLAIYKVNYGSKLFFKDGETVEVGAELGIISEGKVLNNEAKKNIENVTTFVLHGRRGTIEIGDPTSVTARIQQNLPAWRHFTASQVIEIRDSYYSKASICNTKSYCLRPPELRFVSNQTAYIKCFYWKRPKVQKINNHIVSPSQYMLNLDLYKSAWIDGMERQVYLRKEGIDYLLRKYNGRTGTANITCNRSSCTTTHSIPTMMEK